jgi:hypothetical protein
VKTVKFPSLVKKQFCKTPVEVTIYGEGITEDGSPVTAFECKNLYPSENLYPSNLRYGGNAVCNVQSKAKTVYTKEQKIVQVSAVLLFDGDIAPDSPTLSGGFVILDGVKRNIVQGTKHRNPDGTVNFTELDVI